LAAETKYDIVMANILANPLQVLAPALVNKMKAGGRIVLSGVLARQAEEVIATYSQWLKLSVWKESEGWVCLHGTLQVEKNFSKETSSTAPTQKKSLKLALLAVLFVLLIVFGEHLSRNTLLPALAPRIDGSSPSFSVAAFHLLQRIDAKLCHALGCIERTVSDFAAWKITSAALLPETPREGLKSLTNQSLLKVEVQNRLAIAVLAPNLEISLTDAEESDIKSLQFTPQEWLPKIWQETNPRFLITGVPSGEILQIELPITLPANAAGYRVRVLYP
jgi:ribosomal protein L11 methyltransferase